MLQRVLRPSSGYVQVATFTVGLACGGLASWAFLQEHESARVKEAQKELEKARNDLDVAAQKEKLERKLLKLRRQAVERVHWAAGNREVLGLQPRLWMEVLDQEHRYASLLYDYWKRWQLSDTSDNFFEWLDRGQGSLIDLPTAPRRLLDEWRVIYLKKEKQALFRVVIDSKTGRFLWEADGTPVNLPIKAEAQLNPSSPREKEVAQLLLPALERAYRRDELLETARKEVELALERGDPPSEERISELAEPLIQEGLLCQLRDPHWAERLDAAPVTGGHKHLRKMPQLPTVLLPGLGWEALLQAIDHDQGCQMKTPFPIGMARSEGKGIFVLDSFGPLYCGTKIRGVFHHSSFVRGHCVKVAGGITIEDGWLKELSPHSGHYQPGEEHVHEMISDWKQRGVDFTSVQLRPYSKT